MLTTLNIVAPVFAIVALGFYAVKFRFYPATGVSGLIAFVNNFATPFLLFRAMLGVDFESAFKPDVISAFYVGAVAVFVLGLLVSHRIFARRPGDSVSAGFATMFSNTVLLGIPIMQRAYGEDALQTVYTIIGFHATILLPLGMITMEFSRRDGAKLAVTLSQVFTRIVKNPLMIGILAGLLANFAGVQLNEPIDAFTSMMAQAVLPAALFGLGGALNAYRVRDDWRLPLSLSLIKLFFQPAIVWVILVWLLQVEQNIARYAIVLAGMPSGISSYIFATTYKRAEDIAASTVLISTLLSVLSVSFWLYIMAL